MVGDGDERPGLERGVDRTAGVGEDEARDPEPSEDPDAEHDLRGRQTLVQVRAAPHHGDRDAAERPEDERARVAHGGRHGPARDLGVRDLDGILDRVGEPAEAAAEDDADARPGAASRLGARQPPGRARSGRALRASLGQHRRDHLDGLLGLVGQSAADRDRRGRRARRRASDRGSSRASRPSSRCRRARPGSCRSSRSGSASATRTARPSCRSRPGRSRSPPRPSRTSPSVRRSA